jgi:lipopolysaccharide/colanic/teichoic acid biosynthesis glycosyltransferase
MTKFQKTIKRTFDICVSFVGLALLWPLGLAIAMWVKIDSRGPVFFKQTRVGLQGKPFLCIKFRTMVKDSEKGGTVTVSTDSRITHAGKFLRKYKLDEFPQLWNILTGKMSFVGPRPDVPGYADLLDGEQKEVLELRPGITGPATIYFRYEEELLLSVRDPKLFNDTVLWPVKVEMNLQYYKKWGFWKDIGFIVITVVPLLNPILKILPLSPKKVEEIKNRDWDIHHRGH